MPVYNHAIEGLSNKGELLRKASKTRGTNRQVITGNDRELRKEVLRHQ